MRDGEEVFTIGLPLHQFADGGQLSVARIEIDDELRIEVAAGLDADVADDRREMAGLIEKGERREVVGGLEDVALARN